MTKGPNRKILDDYLDTALGGHLQVVGDDWKRKAQDLQKLSNALKLAAAQAELRIGEQTLTGPALRAGMEKSSTSMTEKSDVLRAAGEALVTVGQQINDTKDARDTMADLGPRPAAYEAPANTTGVETTPEELKAQAEAAQARQGEINAWQTQYDKQEARALRLTKQLDAAFLGAIPPMREIHGQDDPTEPTDDVPSGPDGPYLPGTQAPPPTGGGGGGGKNAQGFFVDSWIEHGSEVTNTTTTTTTTTTVNPTNPTVPPTVPPTHPPTSPITPPLVPTETSTVTGSQQSGVTYQGPSASTPTTSGGAGGPSGTNAAAFGAAGAAGGASGMMGGVRAGSAPAPAGSAATRPIGATGRSGSTGALSRTSAASSGSAAGRGAAAGSPTSRGAAGAAGARGATGTTGSAGARGTAGSAGSAGGRGGAGSAGSRGAASGSTAGSRSGGPGASGARGAGAGAAAGRGGRKGERDEAQQRDSLVYDQDWLGDDDVAPGVLD
jgi:hypothetical protein